MLWPSMFCKLFKRALDQKSTRKDNILIPIFLINYIMVQKLILFYLRFEIKVLILKIVMMILNIIQFSPRFCIFFSYTNL